MFFVHNVTPHSFPKQTDPWYRDEEQEKWYFSVVDIVSVASGSSDGRKYRKVLK